MWSYSISLAWATNGKPYGFWRRKSVSRVGGLHGSLTDLDFGHPPRPVPCYPPCFGGAPLLRQQAKSSILRRRSFFDSVSTVCFHSVQQVQQVQQRSTGEFLTLIRFGDRPFRLTSQFESHKIRWFDTVQTIPVRLWILIRKHVIYVTWWYVMIHDVTAGLSILCLGHLTMSVKRDVFPSLSVRLQAMTGSRKPVMQWT